MNKNTIKIKYTGVGRNDADTLRNVLSDCGWTKEGKVTIKMSKKSTISMVILMATTLDDLKKALNTILRKSKRLDMYVNINIFIGRM